MWMLILIVNDFLTSIYIIKFHDMLCDLVANSKKGRIFMKEIE